MPPQLTLELANRKQIKLGPYKRSENGGFNGGIFILIARTDRQYKPAKL